MNNTIIAIDGPAGVGKGTIAKRVAKHFNFIYIDSGSYYRALTYLVLENNINLNDIAKITKLALDMKIEFKDDLIYLNDKDVTKIIRENKINEYVSDIACIKEVRIIINNKIREYAKGNNIVIDGRDATTTIYPNANVKIYLDADITIRAQRRYEQNKELFNNLDENYDTIVDSIQKRDKIIMQKVDGALVITKDTYVIDTGNKTIDEVENEIIKKVEGEVK